MYDLCHGHKLTMVPLAVYSLDLMTSIKSMCGQGWIKKISNWYLVVNGFSTHFLFQYHLHHLFRRVGHFRCCFIHGNAEGWITGTNSMYFTVPSIRFWRVQASSPDCTREVLIYSISSVTCHAHITSIHVSIKYQHFLASRIMTTVT